MQKKFTDSKSEQNHQGYSVKVRIQAEYWYSIPLHYHQKQPSIKGIKASPVKQLAYFILFTLGVQVLALVVEFLGDTQPYIEWSSGEP